MTALHQYQRLEATALWRPSADAQRREVFISLGDATLTIAEFSGTVLTHWSIAAVRRANGTARPAIYHPDGDPDETLEIAGDEDTMIEAIDRVLRAIERKRPHPGKLRVVAGLGAVAAALALATLWLPGALKDYATRIVPDVKRAEIGATLLDQVVRVTGQPCRGRDAVAPLERLGNRLARTGPPWRLVVLPSDLRPSAHLPGRIVLLSRSVFEDHEDPAVAAGFILAEQQRARDTDPLRAVLDAAGLAATVRLLTTGALPQDALAGYAETVLTDRTPPVSADTLLQAFAAAEVASTPYAFALDPTGETVLPLIEGDPGAPGTATAVLSDSDWVRLQGICGA